MALKRTSEQVPVERPLAPYIKELNFIDAIVEGTQQGHIDGYNLGREFRTPLSVGGYVYAQAAYHVISNLRSVKYSGVRFERTPPKFQFNPYKNQIRIEVADLFDTPVRLLLRSGKLVGNYFEVAPLGPVTVKMLDEDHGSFVTPMASLFEPEPVAPEKKTEFIDLYIVYDWTMSETHNPHLTTHLVFPLPAGLKKCSLPFLDQVVLKSGELGPNSFNPLDIVPQSSTVDIDFEVLEKSVVVL